MILNSCVHSLECAPAAGRLKTTGLNPLQYRIREVGAVSFDYEGTLWDTFWERSNPGVPVSEHITKLTGIPDET